MHGCFACKSYGPPPRQLNTKSAGSAEQTTQQDVEVLSVKSNGEGLVDGEPVAKKPARDEEDLDIMREVLAGCERMIRPSHSN